MKLKSSPEDFCVEESIRIRVGRGPHALYRLTKRGIGTPEAVQAILHQWNIPRGQISYGGLKDRHAVTSQHVSILNGPRQNIDQRSLELEYLGQIPRPFVAADIQCNRFRIRLRSIRNADKQHFQRRIDVTRAQGLVNYFDDQRFGSIGVSGELIGVAWCKGDYQRALFLALAEPNTHDRPREKGQKEILRNHWGDWRQCKEQLDRSHRRSIVTYLLDHPTDFKRALALVRQDLRGIYAAAFQSWVWNRWLSRLIVGRLGESHVNWMPSRCGRLALPAPSDGEPSPVWWDLPEGELPLPSARIHAWPEGTLTALEGVLEEVSMTLREMRFKYPRDTFFSKGMRAQRLVPSQLVSDWEPSEGVPGSSDWLLSFELPRGAYATMAIRQWTMADNEADFWGDDEANEDMEGQGGEV